MGAKDVSIDPGIEHHPDYMLPRDYLENDRYVGLEETHQPASRSTSRLMRAGGASSPRAVLSLIVWQDQPSALPLARIVRLPHSSFNPSESTQHPDRGRWNRHSVGLAFVSIYPCSDD